MTPTKLRNARCVDMNPHSRGWPFLAAVCLAVTGGHPLPAQHPLVLATGSPTGHYKQLGDSMSRILAEANPRMQVQVDTSAGSVANIWALKNGDAQLAIVQSDQVHDAEMGINRFAGSPFRGMQAIMGLYYEDVLVIVRKNLGLRDAGGLTRRLRFVLGPPTSGTYANAVNVLKAIGLDEPDVTTLSLDPREALPLLKTDSVDVVFLTASVGPELLAQLESARAEILPLGPDVIETLRTTHPYYESGVVHTGAEAIATVRIRALLVARSSLPTQVVASLTRALFAKLYTLQRSVSGGQEMTAGNVADIHALDLAPGAAAVYCTLGVRDCDHHFVWLAVIAAVIGGLLLVYWFSWRARAVLFVHAPFLRRVVGQRGVTVKYKLFVTVFVLVASMISSAALIQSVERSYAEQHNLHSPFEDISLKQNLLWLFLFTTTDFPEDRFPQSPSGKMISIVEHLVGAAGLVTVGSITVSDTILRRMRMTHGEYFRDHVIIAGWNDHARGIVRGLTDSQLKERRQVVVIAADNVPEAARTEFAGNDYIEFVHGACGDIRVLERAGLDHAHTIVILADPSAAQPDHAALWTLTHVEKRAHRLQTVNARATKLRTIVQATEPAAADAFRDAHADQVVCSGAFEELLLFNSVLSPGISAFLEDMLTVSEETNELIEAPVTGKEKVQLVGLVFDQALSACRPFRVLLVAINRGGAPGVKVARQAAGTTTERRPVPAMMANPFTPEDLAYQIKAGDSLLFIAESERPLEEIFGNAARWKDSFRA